MGKDIADSAEELLNIHDDDFSLWKDHSYGFDWYHIGIEGYIGFESVQSFIDLYELFLNELHEYLIKNKYPKTERERWRIVYSKRAIDICYENEFYWVFLEEYKSTEIWDTYYYLEDVIKQLKEVNIWWVSSLKKK